MRLRCEVCGTPDVLVIIPGHDPLFEAGIAILPGRPQRCFCQAHARRAGWPWVAGEAERRTGQREVDL